MNSRIQKPFVLPEMKPRERVRVRECVFDWYFARKSFSLSLAHSFIVVVPYTAHA